ncbi:MAG: HD domain-containing protein, partial [Candidatus Eremiobacteraeota bacterium]|nr:HD domain-containing protein [Candidatus Eremiobacteraeota bacterium]
MKAGIQAAFQPTTLCPELTAQIVEHGYRGEPPLLASVLAAGLADRILTLPEEGSDVVVAWVRQICERYSLPKAVIAMLESACGTARRVLRVHPETQISEDELAALEHAIGRVIDGCLQNEQRAAEVVETEEVEAAMAGFLARLDDADPASAEHSRAVALWCKRISRRLDMNEEQTIFTARCGLLHDVGKTVTPSEVLQAPRSLTKEEWVVMRAHTTQGARMIHDIPLLRAFAPAARWHHERLDGLGYPDHLPALEIPL